MKKNKYLIHFVGLAREIFNPTPPERVAYSIASNPIINLNQLFHSLHMRIFSKPQLATNKT